MTATRPIAERCVLTSGTDRLLSGLEVVTEGNAVRVSDEELLARLTRPRDV
jgi:hypothetical protein